MPTISKIHNSYICPYQNDIQNMPTSEAVLYLKKKGLKVWQIAQSLNIERSTVYYHQNPKVKLENSLQSSYSRILKIKPELRALKYEDFLSMIQTKGKFICLYSGKEIKLDKDKWAINVRGYVAYIYLKRYNALEKIYNELETISTRFLEQNGYKIEKEGAAF